MLRAVLIVFLLSVGALPQGRFDALEKAIADEMAATGTPGAAIAVVEGDRVTYAKGFGSTSVEGGSAVTADTLFRIGSTTKMFTAAAFAQLAAAGKVKFDAPMSSYVSGLPPRVGKLTAHQMLSQSSGLRDMPTPVMSDDDGALAMNVAGWKDDAFFTDPDTIYSYSSANFWLAGLAVERVHGKPYADAMTELLFQPLGMKRSFLRPREAMTYPLALGHNRQGTQHSVNRPAANNAAIYPGGSIFSSVNDLSRWAIAMLNGGKVDGKQALHPSVVENIVKPQFYLPGGDAFYGYGVLGFSVGCVPTISHGGVSRGYGAYIFFAPQQKAAVILLTNSNGQTMPKSLAAANEILLPKMTCNDGIATGSSTPSADLTPYVGTFSHAPQTWKFTLRDGSLYAESEGKESKMTRSGHDEFVSDQGQFLFVKDKQGKYSHIFMGLYAARRVE
jgi:CubicO group peptidase (beta-lactamase class C family)